MNSLDVASAESEQSAMYHIDVFSSKLHDTKPIVEIIVKDVHIPFEFDTGSAVTILSRNTFNKYLTNPCLSLERSSKVIRVANGGLVHEVYKCSVPVSSKSGKSQLLTLYVVNDDFPSLLGRDWIRQLYGEDWLNNVIVEQVASVQALGKQAFRGPVSEPALQVTSLEASSSGKQAFSEPVTEPALQESVGRSTESVSEHFPLNQVIVGRSNPHIDELKKHPVFKEELGMVEAFPAELKLQPDAEQRFLKISKFRAPEYNIREQLNKTLDDMEADGRLISVDSSPIVSPMRVVVKKDGSLRICGDYKRTLNPLLDTKQYPLPTPEDCFYQMKGGQRFSKIDIRAAYNHILLREEDRYLTTIATPQGLKMWSRLPYGISSA
ncbi:MAG: hypothetical protein GY820_09625 [Gammaproteobacteria bacterium]|nr:hypothetical protein [Gammaproteobacteria bacterium]